MPEHKRIYQGKFKILYNKKIGRDYLRMAIYAPQVVRRAVPGQFVNLRCQDNAEPLLRRPFSFHRLKKHHFEILYKVVGPGTSLLAKKHKGDTIDLLGPLGNGFNLSRYSLLATRYSILVAGGMGVAPLVALAERCPDKKKIIVLLGAKTRQEILCAQDLRKLGCKVRIATNDGSLGYRGLVTDLLKRLLPSTINPAYQARSKAGRHQPSTIYACGPRAMLKEIARISLHSRVSAQGSLEEIMACGLGACLGCAIKTKAGYQLVCKDGPVFNLAEIKW